MFFPTPRVVFRMANGTLYALPVVPLVTRAARAQGYMFRRNYLPTPALLFIFPTVERVAFWMSNTYVSLDLVFIDRDGAIVKVVRAARPGDETPIDAGRPVKYVLELPSGWAMLLGLAEGQAVGFLGLPQRVW